MHLLYYKPSGLPQLFDFGFILHIHLDDFQYFNMGSLSNDDMGFQTPFYRPTKIVDHGKRLLPQALDKLAAEDPEHIIGIIANPGTMPNLTFTSLTSSQMANAVNFTSYWLRELVDKDPYETIAFIGLQDFRYWIITLAAMKTGHLKS